MFTLFPPVFMEVALLQERNPRLNERETIKEG